MHDPTESDLLVEFEQQNIPQHYKQYYVTKRHNLFATIQQFPYIWNCFMHLDGIILREFEMMQHLHDPNLMMPMILFMNAHQKMRTAMELGCATCLTEAHSLVRDAIESAAHGHRLASDPRLLKIWIEKNSGKAAEAAFDEEFQHHKATRVFNGLPELLTLWRRFSEFGSHTNINSIVSRFLVNQNAMDLQFQLNYLGGEPRVLVPALFEIILVFGEIERTLFNLVQSRLQMDTELVEKRNGYDKKKEATRRHIIKTFNLQPPAVQANP